MTTMISLMLPRCPCVSKGILGRRHALVVPCVVTATTTTTCWLLEYTQSMITTNSDGTVGQCLFCYFKTTTRFAPVDMEDTTAINGLNASKHSNEDRNVERQYQGRLDGREGLPVERCVVWDKRCRDIRNVKRVSRSGFFWTLSCLVGFVSLSRLST